MLRWRSATVDNASSACRGARVASMPCGTKPGRRSSRFLHDFYLPVRRYMVHNTSDRSSGDRRPRTWLSLGGLGVELAGAVAGFSLLGFWIDRRYDTAPWGLLVCAICGLVGGFYNFIRSSLKALAPPSSSEGRQSESSPEGGHAGKFTVTESRDDPDSRPEGG